jgi:uncharacterized protein
VTIDTARIELEVGDSGGRYLYRLADGSEAEMAYVENPPGIVTITHTQTPSLHRGQGIAAALVAKAVSDFRAGQKKVITACWFARDQFRAHPEWSDLLAGR